MVGSGSIGGPGFELFEFSFAQIIVSGSNWSYHSDSDRFRLWLAGSEWFRI